jgi:hypothetical protein
MASIAYAASNVVSLEIAQDEVSHLRNSIVRNWGMPRVVRYPAYETLSFAGEEFTFQNEWDDPCLITSTSNGVEILKELCHQLNALK